MNKELLLQAARLLYQYIKGCEDRDEIRTIVGLIELLNQLALRE